MEHPDWYPDWRHDAFHQLMAKIDRLKAEFELSRWPRYDYDLQAGTLTFSDNGVAKVVAEIQVVGTTSNRANNWLWAWANDHWPPERTTDSQKVLHFGEEHGICELTHDYVEDDDINHLGWELTAVAARITDALGAYRPPDETGAMFLLYRSIAWAS